MYLCKKETAFKLALFIIDKRKKNSRRQKEAATEKNRICEQIWLKSKENTFTCEESIKKCGHRVFEF